MMKILTLRFSYCSICRFEVFTSDVKKYWIETSLTFPTGWINLMVIGNKHCDISALSPHIINEGEHDWFSAGVEQIFHSCF